MDDSKLLRLIKKNPNQGMKELIALYGGAVSTICRNFLYDCAEQDIEDAIAETFANFWKHSTTFKLDENYSLKSYIYTIARNVSRDKRRKLKKEDIYSIEETSLELPAEFSLEMYVEKKEVKAVLHACLQNMKEPDKSVFLYRYFYGYKIHQIATMHGLPDKKVENILHRGKGKLRKELIERGIFCV